MRIFALGMAGVVAACGGGGGGNPTFGPLDEAAAVRFCVLAGSCAGAEGVSDCFEDTLPYISRDIGACILRANDCDAARACLGLSIVEDTACAPGQRCEGDHATSCLAGYRAEHDCNAIRDGFTCAIDVDGPTCVCAASYDRCSGDRIEHCELAGYAELDCGRWGWSCVEDPAGSHCTDGVDAPCVAAPPHCEGTVLVSCEGGTVRRRDCSQLVTSWSCHTFGTSSFCGSAEVCPASDKGAETCAGTTLTFCGAGAMHSFDCTALGFPRCQGTRCAGVPF